MKEKVLPLLTHKESFDEKWKKKYIFSFETLPRQCPFQTNILENFFSLTQSFFFSVDIWDRAVWALVIRLGLRKKDSQPMKFTSREVA